jgi:tetratricopeptide (TPR) repeat protein
MTDAYGSYRRLKFGGIALLVLLALFLGRYGWTLRQHVRAETPHLNGEPGALREVLGFPWSDFPSIPEVERTKLDELVPIDAPMAISDVPPWLTLPTDPALGAGEARRNGELQAALNVMRELARSRSADPGAADASPGRRAQIASAREHLAAAERTSSRAMSWIIAYNRGVLYLWQENRQKAAKEFEDAIKSLQRRLDGLPSAEAMSAGIHALYGLGDSLIPAHEEAGPRRAGEIPDKAVDSLRQAVRVSVRLFATAHPPGVAHAAEFFELEPTGLSTRALRNDLIAAYLSAPDYRYCNQPMPAEGCAPRRWDTTNPCDYTNKLFCETAQKASNRLSEIYRRELGRYVKGQMRQGTMWALQNVAEVESENALDEDPHVSYNIAYLLLNLKEPVVAYAYIAPITSKGDQSQVDFRMERLAFVTSILAGAEPAAMSETETGQETSDYRTAYNSLYDAKDLPPPFRPLRVGNARTTKNLDAWLFIRRYRYLLEQGQFETFLREHQRLRTVNALDPKFLDEWKSAVVVEFLQRVGKMRESATPDAKTLIDRFLQRKDLFTDSDLEKAGLSTPFWSPIASARIRFGLGVLGWLALLACYLWLCRAYRATFLSAYREDREAAARAQREYA